METTALRVLSWYHQLSGRLAQRERGATAVEYAIMAGLIAAVVVTAVTALGTATSTDIQSGATALGH